MSAKFVERAIKRADGSEEILRLAVSDLATFYGCCGLFDMCMDSDLMSLSFAGTEPLLDIIGWEPSDVCTVRKGFISYVRPADDGRGAASTGYISDPCADPNGAEYGVCEFLLDGFGRLRREGPTRETTRASLRLCERQPRYRLDGSMISDDIEYGVRIATEGLLQDLRHLIITGNAMTGGQFDGLQRLIKTGYTDPEGRRCTAMDSQVIDWNGNTMAGGAGITWNGRAVGAGFNFVDVLLAIYRSVRQRLSWAPMLGNRVNPGDIVLVMPTFMTQCLLDSFTCWSVCPSTEAMTAFLGTLEGRRYRESLNGGMFGYGQIYLDGFTIPLLGYDWDMINGPTTGDMYMLTMRAAGQKLIQGQFNDLRNATPLLPGQTATDGGRILLWPVSDHTCVKHVVEMQPRILSWAPWAQVRIQDVVCAGVGMPMSPDPWATSFFPETSVEPAECPEAEAEEEQV